jgi:hypothetical protein
MKKFILLVGLLGLIVCLHAERKVIPGLMLKKDAYYLNQNVSEKNWTSYLDDRRKQGDDYMNQEVLEATHAILEQRTFNRELHEQGVGLTQDMSVSNETSKRSSGSQLEESKQLHAARPQLSFFTQCQQFFMRMVAAWNGK